MKNWIFWLKRHFEGLFALKLSFCWWHLVRLHENVKKRANTFQIFGSTRTQTVIASCTEKLLKLSFLKKFLLIRKVRIKFAFLHFTIGNLMILPRVVIQSGNVQDFYGVNTPHSGRPHKMVCWGLKWRHWAFK